MQGKKQQNIEITPAKIKERIRKIANWKAPGPDDVYGYWIKVLVPMQEEIEFHLESCITRGEVQCLWLLDQGACANAGRNRISSGKLYN